MVAILCVQFADKDTVFDARGGVGFSPALDTIEHKYRYEDYWNIIFQPSGNVIHPDSDMPDSYARGDRGFFQYGSLKRYMEDNSFGVHTVIPYQAWREGNGVLNTLTPDTSDLPGRSLVNWLTLQQTKSSFSNPYSIAYAAIDMAIDSLQIEWDSLAVLIIDFAGNSLESASYATVGTYRGIAFTIQSERYDKCFTYPSVLFHEFLHIAKDAWDLHQVLQSPTVSGIGHFSLMGDNAMLGSYTPPMLDPWHRLRYGWLRYYVPDAQSDSLNLVTPIDTTGFTLPIVEQMYEGEPPYVIVIPIKLHPDSNGWVTDNRHYIIVENRRAVGWDKVIAVTEMETTDSSYGDTTGTGGFLVWSSWGGDGRSTPCWIYEADGGFETFKARYLYGAPTDLYGMPDGNRVFSVWSNPGVFHQATPGGIRYLKESRNLYIEFPEYSDSSNVNVIKRLVIDRFVPDVHDLDGGEDGEVSPTKFSAQQRIDVRDTVTLAMFRANTETYVMQGPSVENMRYVAWLENVFGEPDAVVDNGALACFTDTSSTGKFSASYVWQQEMSPTEFKVRVRRVEDKIGQLYTPPRQ